MQRNRKEAFQNGRHKNRKVDDLKQYEAQYLSIIESIEDGYYELDLAGNITFFNEAYRMIYGYSRDELTGMNVFNLADEANAKKAHQYFNTVYTTGIPLKRLEVEIIRKDGVKRDIEASVSLIKNLKGQFIGFRGIIRDVTKYRQMVDLYKTMAENSLAAFFIVQDGKFHFINTSAIANVGYTAEELIGQRADILIHPEDTEMVIEKTREMLRKKDSTPYEFRMVTKNGQIRWLMQIVSPIQYDGKPAILGNAIDITERKLTEGTVRWLAFHDALTGLPNRRLFSDRLAMALAHVRRNRKKLSVLLLDLDKFKHINDTFGHPVGDNLLQAVAKRLTKITRQEDTIARLGGDEFILLLPQINHEADVKIVTERIMVDFQQPFNVDEHNFHVTPSIGYAVYPDDGEDVDTLIKNSDIAMYIAKDRGRNRYERFVPGKD